MHVFDGGRYVALGGELRETACRHTRDVRHHGEADSAQRWKRDFFRPNQVKADHPFYASFTKRSIYLPVVRNALPDVLTVFDAADPYAVTAVRNETTVPAQALFLLNNPFVREQSAHFAKRLLDDAKATDGERIQKAYRLALGRTPRELETKDAIEFVNRYTQLATARGKKTPDARLATEIALALAKASDGNLTALHVFDPQDDTELLRGRARRQGLSVLVDARRLGKRSGVPVKGITLTNSRPEAAILRTARVGRYNLVVVGTS
jgi:nucleotide-binding universal stress UspA family protein